MKGLLTNSETEKQKNISKESQLAEKIKLASHKKQGVITIKTCVGLTYWIRSLQQQRNP